MRANATIALVILTAASLAGCRERAEGKKGAEAGVAAQTQAEGPAAPALSAGRFGPLQRDSKAAKADLERAFPGMTVKPLGKRFQVSRGDAPLFVVARSDDDAVSAVEVLSPDVKTELGPRIGDRFEDLEKTGPLECNGGVDGRAGQVLCSPREARNLAFVFTVSDRRYAGDDVPADKQRGLLAGKAIKRIQWSPPEP